MDDHNRKADAHNKRVIADYNRQVEARNRKADTHNRAVINDLNRQVRQANVRYTEPERRLADPASDAAGAQLDPRDYDTFLSYARIDGQRA